MRLLPGALSILLLLSACTAEASDEITIATRQGYIKLSVEVAKTAAQIQRGLMYRTALPENTGMIFLFAEERPISMWMKNTLIPLDMLFINKAGVIINIAEHTTPESTTPIPSGGDVLAVIELAAGSTSRLHIAKGDRVIYPPFR
jgi:uncharacterized protein